MCDEKALALRHRTHWVIASEQLQNCHSAEDGARVPVIVGGHRTLLRPSSVQVRLRHVCLTCTNLPECGTQNLGTACTYLLERYATPYTFVSLVSEPRHFRSAELLRHGNCWQACPVCPPLLNTDETRLAFV